MSPVQSSRDSNNSISDAITTHSWLCRNVTAMIPQQNQLKLESIQESFSKIARHIETTKVNSRSQNSIDLIKQKKFYEKIKRLTPPTIRNIFLKSELQTFNHVNYYVIKNGIIWFKSINDKKAKWQPIYFEGKSEKVKLEGIRADGANLVVKAENKIYYKKILEESVINGVYNYVDISSENNWIPKWFTLPVISLFENPFVDNHLTLPPNYKGWDISYRGEFSWPVEDGLGIPHSNPLTVTSLYVLHEDGKTIEIFDPYVNVGAHITLSVFETPTSSFQALTLCSSGSTIFVIGYEIIPLSSGGVQKDIKAMTWLIDNDLLGYDPAINYGLGKNIPYPGAFMLPMPNWIDHPFELKKEAGLTKNITIFQTGKGNQSRELRIGGWNQYGEKGFYRKKIDDKNWQFLNYYPLPISMEDKIKSTIIETDEVFTTTISNYEKGNLICSRITKEERINIALLNFGLASLTPTLRIEKNGDIAEFLIFKTKNILNFIFPARRPIYQLVWPPKNDINPLMEKWLNSIFGSFTVMDITITEDKENIYLKPNFFTETNFEFIFTKI